MLGSLLRKTMTSPKKLRSMLVPEKSKDSGLSDEVASYWTEHNVTNHTEFKNEAESLAYFHWRNAQYFNYISFMPVNNQDGKVVLDYGCGPGHDLVGFGHYSKPKKLIGMDVSSSSLQEAEQRLALHNIKADLVLLSASTTKLPLEDHSIDYIHSSGVLHHTPDISAIFQEFKRVLKPDGQIRVMVYNYDSIFLHLYVAYICKIINNQFPGLAIREAFSKTTDGPNCPISNLYTPEEFIQIARDNKFNCHFLGAAVATQEMVWLTQRYDAIINRALPEEHRDFLSRLTFGTDGLPLYNGRYAGIDACFVLEN